MEHLTAIRFAGVVLGGILLSGCAPNQRLLVEGGLRAAQGVKDTEAQALKASICAMSIGAYYRINSDLERRALDALCGGSDGALASVDDLNEARKKAKAGAAGN